MYGMQWDIWRSVCMNGQHDLDIIPGNKLNALKHVDCTERNGLIYIYTFDLENVLMK
jgi:hypothetical protein